MKEHYEQLAKYWKQVANATFAAGYYHLGTLYQRYSEEHAAKANMETA